MNSSNYLSKWFFVALMASAIFLYIFIVTGNPISALTYASHDDALFFRGLENILRGEWLGQYDNLTLAKGPMLSIISAFSSVLGMNAKIFEAFIYLVAAGTLFFIARQIGLPFAAAATLFTFILFNPYLYSGGNRYHRDFLYSSFAILTVALAIGAISTSNKRAGIFLTAGIGIFAGFAFLTREEDIWIIATLGTLFVIGALISVLRRGFLDVLGKWRIVILRAFIASWAFAAIVSPVILTNHFAYGNATVSEFRSSEFRSAMGALGRVGNIHPSGYVPVPQGSLEEVFRVAPVTAGVKEHWQRVGTEWSIFGSDLIPAYPTEVAGGWFAWAFRDAAAAAGHHSSASVARDFYAQLAKEVNSACDEGILTCRRQRASLAPEFTAERLPSLISASWKALLYTISMKGGEVIAARSTGEITALMRWNQLIGPVVIENVMIDPSKEFLIGGWVANMKGYEPVITTLTDSPINIINRTTSTGTDVIAHFEELGSKGVGAVRFSMIVKCLGEGCALSVITEDGKQQIISLNQLVKGQKGAMMLKPPFVGYFDVVDQDLQTSPSSILSPRRFEDIRLNIASSGVKLLHVIVPIFVITATIGMLLYLMRWHQHRCCDWLFVLAAASATAVIGRSVIIAYIDISSWQAISLYYLGPAFGFVIIYSIVGTHIFSNIVGDYFGSRRNRDTSPKRFDES